MINFPLNLIYLRKENKLTEGDMYDYFGLSFRLWRRYELGKSQPKLDTLCYIAEYFNVDINDLLFNDLQDIHLTIESYKQIKKDCLTEDLIESAINPDGSIFTEIKDLKPFLGGLSEN